LFTNEFRLPVTPQEAGLSKFNRPINSFAPRINSYRFAQMRISFLGRGSRVSTTKTVAPGTITVTSACESTVAGGILGLGYVPIEGAADTILLDPTGTFQQHPPDANAVLRYCESSARALFGPDAPCGAAKAPFIADNEHKIAWAY